MRRIALIALSALGLVAQAWAAPAPQLYEVDVLVFANHLPNLDGGEQWNQEKIAPITGFKQALAPSHGLPAGSQLALAQSILSSHPSYTILAARSWVQNAVTLSKTKPVRITSRRDGGRLKGVIRVFQWRLMHVALNLRYIPSDGGSSSISSSDGDSSSGGETSSLSPSSLSASSPATNPVPSYQMIESRPVTLRRTNYFDHPKFGVLVRVVPYKGPLTAPR